MIVAFDTETTGTSKTTDELLQITIVDEHENILLESFVKPIERVSWKNAEAVNRITPDMVRNAPTAKELLPKIKEIFNRAELIIGYNIGFDTGFVEKDCGYEFDTGKIVDCLKVFRKECSDSNIILAHHRLGDAVDFYCPEAKADYLANAHDASCDAIATMRVYLAQADKSRKRHAKTHGMSSETSSFLNNFLQNRTEKGQEQSEEETEHSL